MIKAFEHLSHTVAVEVRDYKDWHKNREQYAVWVIDFDEQVILDEVERTRHFFKDILLKPFDRQPHITLFVSGFLTDIAAHDDDYATTAQQAHQHNLRKSNLKQFDIRIGGLNSFSSALYIEVVDTSNRLEQIRATLAGVMPELRWKPYIPHITVGVYNDAIPTQEVINLINSYKQLTIINKKVRDIKLVTYSSTELLGPLTEHYTHVLVE